MATRGELIGFGPPQSFSQALERLPLEDETEINANGDDGLIEARRHLASLRASLIESIAALATGNTARLSERLVPLSYDDLQLANEIGFRRGNHLASFPWATLEVNNDWAELFLSGDNAYKRWNIWEMTPDLTSLLNGIDDADFDLLKAATPHCICIKTDKHFIPQDQQPIAFGDDDYWYDDNFPYNVGIVTEEELKALLQDLGRRPIT